MCESNVFQVACGSILSPCSSNGLGANGSMFLRVILVIQLVSLSSGFIVSRSVSKGELVCSSVGLLSFIGDVHPPICLLSCLICGRGVV